MKLTRHPLLLPLLVLSIVILAAGLRVYAAHHLLIDHDEPTYIEVAIEYANDIHRGDYRMLAWSETNFEHPVFFKLVYATALLLEPPLERFYPEYFPHRAPIQDAPAVEYGMIGRYVSVVLGVVTAAVLAALNPIAAVFLSIHTLSVKYTSEMYLEALPMLTSFLSVLFFSRALSVEGGRRRRCLLLALSAGMLGVTAASKYVYAAAGIAMALYALAGVARGRLPRGFLVGLVAWGLLAVGVFFAANPYLWPHPVERLLKTLTFHMAYPTAQNVASFHYPFWQPLRWLANPGAHIDLMPASALPVQLDGLIFMFFLLGLHRSARRQPLYFTWFVAALAILLVWSTKWPQYVMILMVPYSVIASQGLITAYEWSRRLFSRSMGQATARP